MSHKETVNKVLDQLLNTIEEQNETIRKLKEQLETSQALHDYSTKELMILSRKVVEIN